MACNHTLSLSILPVILFTAPESCGFFILPLDYGGHSNEFQLRPAGYSFCEKHLFAFIRVGKAAYQEQDKKKARMRGP
jgi:hypothetical protein